MNDAKSLLEKTMKLGKFQMINGKIVSKRYVKDGEIVYMTKLTVHATDNELEKLKNFMKQEGIRYE